MNDGVNIEALVDALVLEAPHTNGHVERLAFPPECRLGDDFWNIDTGDNPLGRRLRHIRQAAQARRRSPTAVMFVVLSRIAAAMPHTVKIDAIVGSEQPLTIYVVTVGPPGFGKGDAATIATRLLPTSALDLLHEGVTDHLPPGSGQGFVDVLFEMVDTDVGAKKPKPVKTQVRNNAFFEMDEGEALMALGGQSGSVLLETLRTVWSGKTVGQVNVDAERRRVLPAGTYAYGVNLQVQPSKAATLIDDDAGGTPQRFLWAATTGHEVHDVDEIVDDPGPLDWRPPGPMVLDRHANRPSSGEYVRHYLTQHPDIEREIIEHDIAVQRGELVLDPLDAHALNMRRRVAAGLTVLGDTLHTDATTWELSALVMGASNATRDVVLGVNRAEKAKEAERRREFQGSVIAAGNQATERQRIVDVAVKIAAKVHAEPERWTFASMRRDGVSAKDREVYVDAVEHAVEMHWVVVDEVDVVASHGGGGTARVLRPGRKKP